MTDRKFLIYKFTSPSGKSYIGQTLDLEKRIRIHKTTNRCRSISRAIEKYGFENLTQEILKENLTIDEANHWEEFYIREHQTLSPNGYNLATGGLNSRPSEETKAKISQSHMGMRLTQDAIERMRAKKIGVKLSEEHRLKIGASQIGRKSPMKDKKHSDETRAKMSASSKLYVFTDTHKKNLSLAQTGKKQSKETIERHSDKKRKSYLVTNPSGEKFVIKGIKLFCRENNLHAGHMTSVAVGKEKSYKGWKCEYFTQ